jgi:hypothetical protein
MSISLGIGFDNIQEPFNKVTVVQHLYTDNLSKDRFFQVLGQVRTAIALAGLKVGGGLEGSEKDQIN